VELLAYILHRRAEGGFLDSLAPASARDLVYLDNLKRPAAPASTGDPEADAFRAMLAEAR
jgi:hypothetical protein